MGSTAIGGPLVGVAGQVFGPRASLLVGALGCLAAVVLALAFGHGARRGERAMSSSKLGATG
jgi:hypothetical protein